MLDLILIGIAGRLCCEVILLTCRFRSCAVLLFALLPIAWLSTGSACIRFFMSIVNSLYMLNMTGYARVPLSKDAYSKRYIFSLHDPQKIVTAASLAGTNPLLAKVPCLIPWTRFHWRIILLQNSQFI
jgi:hypothetical protein